VLGHDPGVEDIGEGIENVVAGQAPNHPFAILLCMYRLIYKSRIKGIVDRVLVNDIRTSQS